MRRITLSIILAFLFCLSDVGQAFAIPQKLRHSGGEYHVAGQNLKASDSRTVEAETTKIISVLKHRIEDQKVLAKTSDKVLTLSAEEIRLLSSLCNRIQDKKRTTRSDAVFSLVTTLIVFS